MPVDRALQVAEFRDFTAGLWTVTDQLMPPNAAQTMTDCYPLPANGLRAWYKPTSFTTSGITSTTNEAPRMIQLFENVDGAQHNDYYLLTYNSSDTKCRLYEFNEVQGDVAWTLIKTFAAGLDPGFIPGAIYTDNLGNLYIAFGLGAAAGTDAGMWYVTYNSGGHATVTLLTANHYTFAFNYQSRLCAVLGGVIHYTDPGTLLNIATNSAPVDINEGQPNILAVATFSPGDLLVFKEGAPIYLVEGDFLNYSVRQMNGSKPLQIGGPVVARGPQGVIFRAGSDGIYESPDGSVLNPLSAQISSQSWITNEPIVFSHHFLLSFENGLVYDYDTHAWFTFSGLPSTHGVGVRRSRLGGVMFTDNSSPFTIWNVIPADGRTDNRAETYTWKSAPLRDPAGRQIEIRQVEVYARSTNGATSTITVTVNGFGQTVACDSSGRGAITFYGLQRREELDVQVIAASNASGVEAPRIETIKVGTRTGHFLTTGADVG